MERGSRIAMVADSATVVVTAAALVLVSTTLWDRMGGGDGATDRYIDEWEDLARDSHWRGPADASVVVLEFGDYECPFCRRLEPTLEALREEFPDQVALAYRHFPLAQHAHAYEAALMAECGALQDRFVEVHALLYDMPDLSELVVDDVAIATDMPDPTQFEQCVVQGEHVRIERDLALARSLDVRSTPTVIVNGRLLSPAPTPDSLKAMVRRLVDG